MTSCHRRANASRRSRGDCARCSRRTTTARSARRSRSAPSCSRARSARRPTSSRRRCTPSTTATARRSRCAPRAPRRSCAPRSKPAWRSAIRWRSSTTSGPMFRRERPQKGRSRQFHQLGAELIGRDDPLADAEVVMLLADCLAAAGLDGAELILNSLGDETCRPPYRAALDRVRPRAHRRALRQLPPAPRAQSAPPPRLQGRGLPARDGRRAAGDATTSATPCRAHFAEVERLLRAADVPFRVNPRLVRGLDYYVRTAFEVVAGNLGAQNAVGGGGRYDGLVAGARRPAAAGHRLRDRSRAAR